MTLNFPSTVNVPVVAQQKKDGIFQSIPSIKWHRVTLQRINALPARRQMCSLWLEWSTNHGDCQGEFWLILHWSHGEAAESVCLCLHSGEYSVTKTPNSTWISRFFCGHLIFSWSCSHCILNRVFVVFEIWYWSLFDVTLKFMKAAVCRGIIAQGISVGSFSHQFFKKTPKCY